MIFLFFKKTKEEEEDMSFKFETKRAKRSQVEKNMNNKEIKREGTNRRVFNSKLKRGGKETLPAAHLNTLNCTDMHRLGRETLSLHL